MQKTRFAHCVDIAKRCTRKRKGVLEMVKDESFLKKKVSDSASAKAALKEFLDIVDDRQPQLDIKVFLETTFPMRV